jgi:hypothetical protein
MFRDLLLSLKTVVNVPLIGNKQKKSLNKIFFVSISKATEEKCRIQIRDQVSRSKDSDPSKNVTDPKH